MQRQEILIKTHQVTLIFKHKNYNSLRTSITNCLTRQ